jgi:hypothetical protein
MHGLPYLDLSARPAAAQLRQLRQTLPCSRDPLNGDYTLHPVLLSPKNMRRASFVYIISRIKAYDQSTISDISFQP